MIATIITMMRDKGRRPAFVYVGRNQTRLIREAMAENNCLVAIHRNNMTGRLPPIDGAQIMEVNLDDHLEISYREQ